MIKEILIFFFVILLAIGIILSLSYVDAQLKTKGVQNNSKFPEDTLEACQKRNAILINTLLTFIEILLLIKK